MNRKHKNTKVGHSFGIVYAHFKLVGAKFAYRLPVR